MLNSREGGTSKGSKMMYLSHAILILLWQMEKLLESLSEVMTYLHHASSFAMYKLGVWMKANACSPPISRIIDPPG